MPNVHDNASSDLLKQIGDRYHYGNQSRGYFNYGRPLHIWPPAVPRLAARPSQSNPRPWFNIKMSSYQYRKSHCGDKTVVRSSYLHNGISYTGKMTSFYWIGAQGVWARGSEAWAGSRDLRNLEFVRWGSSGPSSLMHELINQSIFPVFRVRNPFGTQCMISNWVYSILTSGFHFRFFFYIYIYLYIYFNHFTIWLYQRCIHEGGQAHACTSCC